MAATPPVTGSASLADILTAAKNIVLALNGATTAYLNVNGQATRSNITAPTVLKTSTGRVASVSVTVAGSAVGHIYDSAATTDTSEVLYVIPEAVGTEPYVVNLPVSFGILIVPGTGQTLAVSYS